MSRSRAKKFRFCYTDRKMKKLANKKVRQNKTFNTFGKVYKRLFQSWTINDSGRAKSIPEGEDSWKRKARRK